MNKQQLAMAINSIEVCLEVLKADDCTGTQCEFCAGYRIAGCKTGNAIVFAECVLGRLKEGNT